MTYPDAVNALFSCETSEFIVSDRPVAMEITSGHLTATAGTAFDVTVQMVDAYSRNVIEDIGWRVRAALI